MYSEINTIFRKQINSKPINYLSSPLEHAWISESYTESGPYVQVSTEYADPISQEIGFDASQELQGFLQFLVKLPISDNGLNFAVNDIAAQYFFSYPRQSFVEDGIKVEYRSVGRPIVIRDDGYVTVTVRVSFSAFYCV
ncbi:tail-completion protein [Vibrio phage LP.2]|nr:tail-completion protein [Vibrio phage LP.2]